MILFIEKAGPTFRNTFNDTRINEKFPRYYDDILSKVEEYVEVDDRTYLIAYNVIQMKWERR